MARQLGKYELFERVGIGGMGEVYRARASDAAADVALKVLLPDAQRDPLAVDMFIDEAAIGGELDHPNVVSVSDFGQVDGLHYMAMAFVDGWDLRRLLDAVPDGLPVRIAGYIVREVCLALEYIHNHPRAIVHRDVSPHNIFIDRRGHVKLSDFGIAKGEARRTRTESGMIKGQVDLSCA